MEKIFAKLSLLFLVAGTICLIIGISTPYWISSNGHYSGLWVYCFYPLHTPGTTCLKLEQRPDFVNWIQGVRVLEIASCVAAAVNVILLLVYIKKEDGRPNLKRIRVVLLLCVLSSVLCLAGILLYGVQKYHGYGGHGKVLGWSFIITAVAGGILALLAAPLAIEIRQGRRLGYYESM